MEADRDIEIDGESRDGKQTVPRDQNIPKLDFVPRRQ